MSQQVSNKNADKNWPIGYIGTIAYTKLEIFSTGKCMMLSLCNSCIAYNRAGNVTLMKRY